MEDQKVGGDVLRGWVGWGIKWGCLVVGLGLVDEWVLGGRSGVLGGVRGLWGWVFGGG